MYIGDIEISKVYYGDIYIQAVYYGDELLDFEGVIWWKIDTLDEADIIGVWDFGWNGHSNADNAKTDLVNGLQFVTSAGSPNLQLGNGFNFGGGGAAEVQTNNIDWNEASFIIEFANWVKNGTLDAAFSHFTSGSHYVLQQDFDTGEQKVRWSAGDSVAGTFELNEIIDAGIYGGSGPRLYKEGNFKGEIPGTLSAIESIEFTLGALNLGANLTQFSKILIKKLLLVNRRLTDSEQSQISNQIKGIGPNVVTHNGEVVTNNGEVVTN